MFPGIKYTFPNGEKLVVPPLSLGSVEELEKEHGKVSTWGQPGSEFGVDFVLELVGHSLRRNYPDVTDEKIKNELVDLGNMNEVVSAIMDINGSKRKEQEAGELQPGQA